MASRNRGKKKPKLRDLSRTIPPREERASLRKSLSPEDPPLVTAIVGQVLLESELDELLRPHFARRDDDTWEKLTGAGGPLSSFSNKIVVGHAFGIFNDVVKDGLNTVREIRNAFAHGRQALDFSHELIVHELRTVTLPSATRSSLYRGLSLVRKAAAMQPPAPRQAYIGLCLEIYAELVSRSAARSRAASYRLSRRYQKGLLGALTGAPPGRPLKGLLHAWENQTADPKTPTPQPKP